MAFCDDLRTISLGDKRLNDRAHRLVQRIRECPGASFPNLLRTTAELEGAYRWFGHDEISPVSILAPHFERSADRVRARDGVIVIHDTMDVETAKNVGYRVQSALAISDPVNRIPLGLLSFIPVLRHPREKKEAGDSNEFSRWAQSIRNVRKALGPTANVVHVGDSETDSYELMANAMAASEKFVFRLYKERNIIHEGIEKPLKLSALVGGLTSITEREVALSPRKRGNKSNADTKTHPLRKARTAKLKFSAATIVLSRPKHLQDDLPSAITLNVISVAEIDPPEDAEPVEWLLATNLPIFDTDKVLEIVDIYRARWTIEEYHKALKTGCSLEARQLESQHAMLNVTALLAPSALDLLALKTTSRIYPETLASTLLSETRLRVLAHFSPIKLPRNPTVKEAYAAVAKLGGHIKNNGEPGWIVLSRGYQQLLTYEVAWEAGRQSVTM